MRQDCLSENIGSIFLSYYNDAVFSAASLALSSLLENPSENWFANIGTVDEKKRQNVHEHSLFDLASLTKPLVTLPSVLHLIDTGIISWDESLSSLLERDVPQPFGEVSLANLLSHHAGFTAHEDYWKTLKSMQNDRQAAWLIEEIINSDPAYETGGSHRYSDLGYLLLGYIIELKAGKRIDKYWQAFVAEPLGMEDELHYPAAPGKDVFGPYVPTGVCRWSGRALTGVVHDDNSRALGGITGHAGLFGSSSAVLALCKEFFFLYHGLPSRLPILSETFKQACSRVRGSEWTCGFNLPSPSGSSSGRWFSPNSIGHLGFTGVSFWIDIDRGLIVCLLTNRVVKGESREGIRAMRSEVHDAVVACLPDTPRNSR